jgi:ABC-type phosphate transport system permease subunit
MADLSLEKTLEKKASMNRLRRKPRWGETIIQGLLFFSGFFSIFTTVGIVYELGKEALLFFQMPEVNLLATLTTTEWKPHIGKFGIWPLLNATLMTTLIAMLIAIPLGMAVAIYLSEYAKPRVRSTLKPILEVLAGIPTIVYGYFALTFMTPLLREIFGRDVVQIYNTASAGLVMGILILPLITSMTEDALSAVPRSLREAAYGMGATKLEVALQIVVPAALASHWRDHDRGCGCRRGTQLYPQSIRGCRDHHRAHCENFGRRPQLRLHRLQQHFCAGAVPVLCYPGAQHDQPGDCAPLP